MRHSITPPNTWADPSRVWASPPADVAFFETHIRSALVWHCDECHSRQSKSVKSGLRLDSREALHQNGDSGPVTIPNDPEPSLLIQSLKYQNDLEMPPSGQLPNHIIQAFEKWIASGASDPRTDSQPANDDTPLKSEPHWSLQPLKSESPSTMNKPEWIIQPIDRFILAQMEEETIEPSPDANWYTPPRRLNFDLIGLPPTPAEIEAFIADMMSDTEQALSEKVDQLLATPQFGERWARSLARRSALLGKQRQESRHLAPSRQRYRNWIIEAINRDLPYDEFIHQQIAGDLLPTASNEAHQDQQIATPFLAY
ncbi:MAG: hypothetical protein M2R45_04781 [Verrucomicrobia subdivision 3 bacterium]|nr:hypothetical protein [Limisphaerales bacterium]MCS1417426.1 hypothetical protein [Limisphaerales bacterium]